MSKFYVDVQFDNESMSVGWDGDAPLDPKHEWSAYDLMLIKVEKNGDEEIVDHIGGVWASDNASGIRYIRSVIRDHFCSKTREDAPKSLRGLQINLP